MGSTYQAVSLKTPFAPTNGDGAGLTGDGHSGSKVLGCGRRSRGAGPNGLPLLGTQRRVVSVQGDEACFFSDDGDAKWNSWLQSYKV